MSYPKLSSLETEGTDIIFYDLSEGEPNARSERYVVYLLPGNPGLISFYSPFLSLLSTRVKESSLAQEFALRVCGKSLKGFELRSDDADRGSISPAGLEEMILEAEKHLYSLAPSESLVSGSRPLKVILIGHSVGAYILLELIQRNKSLQEKPIKPINIIGGILLFPTITGIAKSPLGRFIAVRSCPYFVFPHSCF